MSLLHGYSTPLFHVLISPFHGYSNVLDTIFHVNICYTRYYCSMYMSRYYIELRYMTLLLHVHEPLIHRYAITLLPLHEYSVHSYFIFLYHSYIDSPVRALIVSVFLLHVSLFILLLHEYSCITVTWLFLVTGHVSY